MSATQHVLHKQTLRLRAGSQALALALQPRLGDLNRRRLLPVIEKVFNEMDVPGRHVRIGRLEVDLGRFSLAGLEGEVEGRLEAALRRSLEKALGESPGAEEAIRSREESRLELLEHCLIHGTLPWWAPRQPSFSLEALFLEVAAENPEGLVAAVRDLGRDRRVQERLAAQLREPALRRLVRMLEPEHALLIFTYLGNVREVHRGEPVLPLSERAMARVLWVLTQAYLLNDPGSAFNRRSFVKSLLRGLAAREGLRYEEVLAALLRGLERTARRHPTQSSLPAVLEELALTMGTAEGPPDPEGDPDGLDDTWVDGRPASFDHLLGRLCPREAGALRDLLRAFGRIPAPYRPRPEALVRQAILGEALRLQAGEPLGAESFERVLRELFAAPLAEPVHRVLKQESAGWSGHGEAFLAALSAVSAPRPDEDPRQPLLEILAGPPEVARGFLRRHGDHRTRERWVKLLPESGLVRLAAVLAPRKHRVLLSAAEVLAAAWTETAPRQHPDLTDRKAFWSFLLGFLLTSSGGKGLSVERLVAAFFEHTAAASPSSSRRGDTGARLLEAAGRWARAGGYAALANALHRRRPARKPDRPRRREDPDRADETEPLYVGNAGLVLAGPFLPHLFKTLGLLHTGDDGRTRLRDGEALSRAVHLLQLLVTGRADTPEPELALNKVLCGVPVATAVDREVVPTEQELEVCGQLLRSITANWDAVSNTSVAGLQETFLRREGRLQSTGDGWKLQVQRKTVDFLVDQVPWSVSVIFHGWMPQPLHVTW